jgi:L-seryl-tRNA(Ser) seleniumtransferase
MKVHWSNYAITGFTAQADEGELIALAHARGLPMVIDLGSGTLTDLARFGLPHEPLPQDSLRAGADLVTFSGDKLLGGPQAGLLVGRRELIAKIKENPLKRALRVGKVTMAALEAVLRLYQDPDRLPERLTVLKLLTRGPADIAAQAARVRPALEAWLAATAPDAWSVEDAAMLSQIGSGSLPVERLPSHGLRIAPVEKRGAGKRLRELEARLRALPLPVIGYVRDDALHFDLRCLTDEAALIAQWHVAETPA